MPREKTFQQLTLVQRKDVSDMKARGASTIEISHKLGCSVRTIQRQIAKQEQYENIMNTGISPKMKSVRHSRFEEEEGRLAAWLDEAVDKGDVIPGFILTQRMKRIVAETRGIKEEEVKLPAGWLDTWKNRYQVKSFGTHGERRSADIEAALNFRPSLLCHMEWQHISPKAIFNMDETGLFWKRVVTKTLARVPKVRTMVMGSKVPGERLGIGLCCNMEGHFLRPIVCWRSKKPRCCKGWDLQSPQSPFWYVQSKKSWFVKEAFQTWFQFEFVPAVRAYLTSQHLPPRAFLLIDNAPTHMQLDIEQFSVYFLPKNTTSLIQPLDNGIIRWFKSVYWSAAASRCLRETGDVAGGQAAWFQTMKVRTSLELIRDIMQSRVRTPEGAAITRKCWDSALGLCDSISQDTYLTRLSKRLPPSPLVQELMEDLHSRALLLHLEQMEAEDRMEAEKAADQDDAEVESDEEVTPDKLDELRRLAEFCSKSSQARQILQQALQGLPPSE
jgi:hypothetical protein